MAFTLSALDYTLGSPSYTAQQDRLMMLGLAGTEGVRLMPSTTTGELAVTTTGAANGSANVSAGHILIAGATGQGAYYAYNDAATTVGPFAANSSGNPRIDVVVVRVTDSASPSVALAILQGTPAASPTAPTVTKTTGTIEVALAQVAIPNGWTTSTTLSAGNITDVRPKSFVVNSQVSATTTAGIAVQIPSPTVGQIVLDGNGIARIYDGTGWAVLYASSSSTGATAYTPSFAGTSGPTGFTANFGRWEYQFAGGGIGKLLLHTQVTLTSATWGAGNATVLNLPLWNATTAFAPVTTGLVASSSVIGSATGLYINGAAVYPISVAYNAAASGATPAQVRLYAPASATATNLANVSATAPMASAIGVVISVALEVPVSAIY